MDADTPVPRASPIPLLSSPRKSQSSAASDRVRYVGVDLARFLAIVGMMAAHLVVLGGVSPTASDFDRGAAELADALTSGIAAPLFAVLGGVSAVFATRRLLSEGRVGAAIGAVMIRGTVLVLVGLSLGTLIDLIVGRGFILAVVLVYFGVAMILFAPLIAVRVWVLASIAIVFALAGARLTRSSGRLLTSWRKVCRRSRLAQLSLIQSAPFGRSF